MSLTTFTISRANYDEAVEWMEDRLAVPVGLQFNKVGSGSYVVMLAVLLRLTIGLPVDAEFLLSFFFAALLMAFRNH